MRTLLLYSFLIITSLAHASIWSDVWKNTNQRAMILLEQERFEAAENLFTRKDWQAVAAFRGKNYAKAAQGFQTQNGAEGLYNQGNALAFQGKYKEAINTYTQALKLEPHHVDAEYNRALLETLLKNTPPESDESKSNQSNDQGNSNQEQAPQHSGNQDASEQKKDGSNNTPSKPQSSESHPESETPTKPEEAPESEAPPESGEAPKDNAAANTQPPPEESSQYANASSPTNADKQEKEQWLRLIPDDPGGLLREKFWRDHMKRLQQRRS